MHEQYRPFVMFHHVQSQALTKLQANDPAAAVGVITQGLESLAKLFAQHDAEEHFDEDLFVVKLREMQESIKSQFSLGPSLAEQLAEAVAAEQYELAAKLRDKLARGPREAPRVRSDEARMPRCAARSESRFARIGITDHLLSARAASLTPFLSNLWQLVHRRRVHAGAVGNERNSLRSRRVRAISAR